MKCYIFTIVIVLLTFFAAFFPKLVQAECQATISESVSLRNFVDNEDGTVTDSVTKLMWQKCIEGKGYKINECSGSGRKFSWEQALHWSTSVNESGGFAGYEDWRLPNVKELRSLVEEACVSPAINEIRFPNVPRSSSNFWTSTPSVWNDTAVWAVNFYQGHSYTQDRSNFAYVRLVRDE